jgi:DnaA family protein
LSSQGVLSIDVLHQPKLTNFVVGDNVELVEALASPVSGFGGFWICGEEVCGKSHLLRGAALAAAETGQVNAYLDCAQLSSASIVETLVGLTAKVRDGMDLSVTVAVDHVAHLQHQGDAEEALMALYNALQELPPQGGVIRRLLVAHRQGAGQLAFGLQDLNSRMRAMAHHRVRELSDFDKGCLLRDRAQRSGYHLSEAVLEYWLRRGPRGMDRLLADLATLDRATLQHKRLLTVPLLKSVLGY